MIEETYTTPYRILREQQVLEMFGKGFTPSELAAAYSLTMEQTGIKDHCADFVRFTLADIQGAHIATRTLNGY
jgi:hypothetical protein